MKNPNIFIRKQIPQTQLHRNSHIPRLRQQITRNFNASIKRKHFNDSNDQLYNSAFIDRLK